MIHWWFVIPAFVAGTLVGLLLMAALAAGGRADDEAERMLAGIQHPGVELAGDPNRTECERAGQDGTDYVLMGKPVYVPPRSWPVEEAQND